MGLGYEVSKKSISIYVESDIKLKDFITYRTTKSMVILCEGNNGQNKETSEIHLVNQAHTFTGHISIYFLQTFVSKRLARSSKLNTIAV